MSTFPTAHAEDDYCYLLTTGRKTGMERETEIWFALHDGSLYVLAGSGEAAGWVRNLRAEPRLRIRLAGATFECRARDAASPEEDTLARRLLYEKYQPRQSGDLQDWSKRALPLAFEVVA